MVLMFLLSLVAPGSICAEVSPKMIANSGLFAVPGDNLHIEYVFRIPGGKQVCPGVVLCHPDPRMGGSMDSYVLAAIETKLLKQGFACLRFNFRGVGESEGMFDNRKGEKRDLLAAIRFLKAQPRVGANRVFVCGYSFGAAVGFDAVSAEGGVRAFAALAYPNDYFKEVVLPAQTNNLSPMLFLGGDRDRWCHIPELEKLFQKKSLKAKFVIIPGADHFYRTPGNLEVAAGRVVRFFTGQLNRQNP